jgi:hypothetical protein
LTTTFSPVIISCCWAGLPTQPVQAICIETGMDDMPVLFAKIDNEKKLGPWSVNALVSLRI